MAKTNISELVFIIDKSGSMAGLESDTIGGINATLADNRKVEGTCFVSLVQFNHASEVTHDRVPIERVKPLTERDYHVGGCTALLDAVGGAIKYHDKVQKILPETHRANHLIFVIITDGLENASHDFDYPQVKRLIEAKKEEGWEFLFLGANIDVAAEAARLGINPNHASAYVADAAGSEIAYEAVSQACVESRAHGFVSSNWKAKAEADAAKRSFFRRKH